ncbi:hypothetical protein FB45DRAFT_324588 [Roridomyces roridus]|uniref:Uncharacterized protein n=1 Tax=Roridomyces roridus TaxID=1738132 RepID=A0AAD7B4X5_9AGAR|nr:hypothetical protein FB45DRAFT_324588 [Roridomyces roridus]
MHSCLMLLWVGLSMIHSGQRSGGARVPPTEVERLRPRPAEAVHNPKLKLPSLCVIISDTCHCSAADICFVASYTGTERWMDGHAVPAASAVLNSFVEVEGGDADLAWDGFEMIYGMVMPG